MFFSNKLYQKAAGKSTVQPRYPAQTVADSLAGASAAEKISQEDGKTVLPAVYSCIVPVFAVIFSPRPR
jgi:hypothetical protein